MVGKYAKGARFERKVRDFLEEDGWLVIRSAGSHTVSDLVAIRPGFIIWLIQCKIDGKLKSEERDILLLLEKQFNIIPMLAYNDRGKVKFSPIISKQPTFHYEVIDGSWVKIQNK